MIDAWNIVKTSARIGPATNDKVADKVVDAQIVHSRTQAASRRGYVIVGGALGSSLFDTLNSLVCVVAEDELPLISVSGTFLT
jgi:hypothetical protein